MARRFKMLLATFVVAGVTAGVAVGVASASTPTTVGGGWQAFNWVGGNGAVPGESPFTFTATAPVLVTATDILCVGDRFTISDGLTTLGTTSLPGLTSCTYSGFTANPDTALADPNYSHGLFAVGTGAHSIGIVVSTSPFGLGTAYIRFDTMTKDNCKNGGWQTIASSPPFKNQGDCVSFVATGGKNPPG